MEVVLAGLFLNGDADRDREDWTEMSVKYVYLLILAAALTESRLPFVDDNNCGLGIAVRTYLDDLPCQGDPTSPEARAEVKGKGKEWFQHSESFEGNLKRGFKLWDAVSTCLKSSGDADRLRSTKERRARARRLKRQRCLRMPTAGWRRDGRVIETDGFAAECICRSRQDTGNNISWL
jgi:hypothetical protein